MTVIKTVPRCITTIFPKSGGRKNTFNQNTHFCWVQKSSMKEDEPYRHRCKWQWKTLLVIFRVLRVYNCGARTSVTTAGRPVYPVVIANLFEPMRKQVCRTIIILWNHNKLISMRITGLDQFYKTARTRTRSDGKGHTYMDVQSKFSAFQRQTTYEGHDCFSKCATPHVFTHADDRVQGKGQSVLHDAGNIPHYLRLARKYWHNCCVLSWLQWRNCYNFYKRNPYAKMMLHIYDGQAN